MLATMSLLLMLLELAEDLLLLLEDLILLHLLFGHLLQDLGRNLLLLSRLFALGGIEIDLLLFLWFVCVLFLRPLLVLV